MHKSSHGTVRHFLMFSMITARSLASVLPEASCTTCNSSSPQPAVMAFPPGEASVKLPAFQQPQTKSTPKLFVFSFYMPTSIGKTRHTQMLRGFVWVSSRRDCSYPCLFCFSLLFHPFLSVCHFSTGGYSEKNV